ncbi:MAG: hypothetical protein J2O46_08845, partial [Nocardioides sp.]|nr:hypothetical protein [Nocardioides sp.]
AHPGPSLLLGGGVALYLVGQGWFRAAAGVTDVVAPFVAAACALATVPLGVALGASAQLAVLTVVAVALVVRTRVSGS